MTETKTDDLRRLNVLVGQFERSADIEWRWYGFGSLSKRWIPSCWSRKTLSEATALMEDKRFIASGMMKTPLKLVREETHYYEIDVPNENNEGRIAPKETPNER